MSITLIIAGEPRPGGSKTAQVVYRKGGIPVKTASGRIMTTVRDAGGEKTANWRSHVTSVAREQYQGDPLQGPLAMLVLFVMPRIKGHFRANGDIKPNAPTFHTVKPDTTKLLRALEDSLTKICWIDDTQIVVQLAAKKYGNKPGAFVFIASLAQSQTHGFDALAAKAVEWNLLTGSDK